jgi:acylphosphatase
MAKEQSDGKARTQTLHLIIHGRVQGVGFRNYLSYKAGALGIRGWVRNRRDGSVETVIQGTPDAVAEMLACAHRGPRASNVTAVNTSEPDADNYPVYSEYLVNPTA